MWLQWQRAWQPFPMYSCGNTNRGRLLSGPSYTSFTIPGVLAPFQGETRIFITPGYTITSVDAMVTNFHLPESTLLMMISAFAGRARVFQQLIVPARMKATAAVWKRWASHQRLSGDGAVPDYADPEQMNRYIWYQDHNWTVPYPGDARVDLPGQVPGGFIPSSDPN